MTKNLKSMKFTSEPLEELICHLEIEASEWCLKNCRNHDDCFVGGVAFKIRSIRLCGKIPTLYKLYWEAKNSNIGVISPLVIFHAKEGKDEK